LVSTASSVNPHNSRILGLTIYYFTVVIVQYITIGFADKCQDVALLINTYLGQYLFETWEAFLKQFPYSVLFLIGTIPPSLVWLQFFFKRLLTSQEYPCGLCCDWLRQVANVTTLLEAAIYATRRISLFAQAHIFYAFLKPDFGCKSENKCKSTGLEADT